jgi:hypothetical protein
LLDAAPPYPQYADDFFEVRQLAAAFKGRSIICCSRLCMESASKLTRSPGSIIRPFIRRDPALLPVLRLYAES